MSDPAGRVLLVDDDPTILDVVTRYLQRAGFDVATASDGASALAAAERGTPDLVVLDVMLPGIDGLGTSAREQHPHLPLVANLLPLQRGRDPFSLNVV